MSLYCVVELINPETLEPIVIQSKENAMGALVGVNSTTAYRIGLYEDHIPQPIFPWVDLSVRQEGYYKLRFSLFEVRCDPHHGLTFMPLAKVDSNTFQVYSAKSFPCMSPSTAITETLKKHGIRVRVSKTTRQTRTRANQVPRLCHFWVLF